MKKIKNSCPQKTYTRRLASLTCCLFFSQYGCEVSVGGSRGQSHVGGSWKAVWYLQKCKCKMEILQPGKLGLNIHSPN